MNVNKTLVRLKDAARDAMICCFFTENGIDFLKQYDYCFKNDISIQIPKDLDKDDCYYNDCESGSIEDIEIGFGGNESIPYIDVWLEHIF